MSANLDTALLQRFRCFQDLSEAEAEAVAPHIQPVQLSAGQVLFHQGDPGDSLYLVASGQVDIQIKVPGQADRVLSTLEAGAIFGEISLLLKQARNATAIAKTAAEVWKISHAEFEAALNAGEAWAGKFLLATSQVLAHRLAALDQELVNVIAEMRQGEPTPRVAELETLRQRLFTEWSF